MIWLPDFIYELFPYFTGLVGLISLIHSNGFLMFFSASQLLLTSAVIFMMRRRYRRSRVLIHG